MPVLNITCPICTEVFGNSDDIYSTSCGHLFHFVCMRDWQSRATSCPQCRSYGPTTHKLYLSFDDTDESPKVNEELEIKLKSSVEKIQRLYEQIQEGDINFLHLQEQFNRSEELIRTLEENVRQLKDSETNFLHLQGQYTESEEHNRELRETVQTLTIENEYKQKEMNLKITEIDTLKTALENNESQTSDIYLNGKIKTLEQKLKNIMTEFEKEISNNTQLSIDNMKLNSYIDRMKLEANIEESTESENKNLPMPNNNLTKKTNNRFREPMSNHAVRMHQSPSCSILTLRSKQENQRDSTTDSIPNFNDVTSVAIRNFPLTQISYPLENIIIAVASIMNLNISQEDLVKVSIMERRIHLPKKVTLVVKFKSLDLKVKFLSNKNKLKNHPTYDSLAIREYTDEYTNSVFVYANKNLRASGFSYICLKNNQIIVKRRFSDAKSILITSKAQVDDLIKNNVSSNEPTTPPVLPILTPPVLPIPFDDKVDECFYKI